MPLAREIKEDREGWAEDSQGPSHSQAALGLPLDGRGLAVRCRPHRVCVLPAGTADDRELPAVPPAQGLALRRPLHELHQGGEWPLHPPHQGHLLGAIEQSRAQVWESSPCELGPELVSSGAKGLSRDQSYKVAERLRPWHIVGAQCVGGIVSRTQPGF